MGTLFSNEEKCKECDEPLKSVEDKLRCKNVYSLIESSSDIDMNDTVYPVFRNLKISFMDDSNIRKYITFHNDTLSVLPYTSDIQMHQLFDILLDSDGKYIFKHTLTGKFLSVPYILSDNNPTTRDNISLANFAYSTFERINEGTKRRFSLFYGDTGKYISVLSTGVSVGSLTSFLGLSSTKTIWSATSSDNKEIIIPVTWEMCYKTFERNVSTNVKEMSGNDVSKLINTLSDVAPEHAKTACSFKHELIVPRNDYMYFNGIRYSGIKAFRNTRLGVTIGGDIFYLTYKNNRVYATKNKESFFQLFDMTMAGRDTFTIRHVATGMYMIATEDLTASFHIGEHSEQNPLNEQQLHMKRDYKGNDKTFVFYLHQTPNQDYRVYLSAHTQQPDGSYSVSFLKTPTSDSMYIWNVYDINYETTLSLQPKHNEVRTWIIHGEEAYHPSTNNVVLTNLLGDLKAGNPSDFNTLCPQSS